MLNFISLFHCRPALSCCYFFQFYPILVLCLFMITNKRKNHLSVECVFWRDQMCKLIQKISLSTEVIRMIFSPHHRSVTNNLYFVIVQKRNKQTLLMPKLLRNWFLHGSRLITPNLDFLGSIPVSNKRATEKCLIVILVLCHSVFFSQKVSFSYIFCRPCWSTLWLISCNALMQFNYALLRYNHTLQTQFILCRIWLC